MCDEYAGALVNCAIIEYGVQTKAILLIEHALQRAVESDKCGRRITESASRRVSRRGGLSRRRAAPHAPTARPPPTTHAHRHGLGPPRAACDTYSAVARDGPRAYRRRGAPYELTARVPPLLRDGDRPALTRKRRDANTHIVIMLNILHRLNDVESESGLIGTVTERKVADVKVAAGLRTAHKINCKHGYILIYCNTSIGVMC